MHRNCGHCNLRFEPEPGYFYGAMFISYIISGWMLLLPALALVFYFKWTVGQAMAFTIGLTILTYLKILRGSRVVWLHLMVKYDPKKAKPSA